MRFNSVPFLARVTPAGGGGGGSLTIVQQPAGVESWGNQAEVTLSAVGLGNGLLAAFRCATAAGTPTITDSAGGSWGAAVHSYAETSSNSTTYYFIRSGVTGNPTWVRANTTGSDEYRLAVIEVSGGTPVLDGTPLGATVPSLTDPWVLNFTTTQANAILMGMAVFSNNTTVANTAPITADSSSAYFGYYRGQFASSGSNSATLDLNDSRTGSYSAIVVKAS